MLMETKVLSLLEELCIMRVATVKSLVRVLNSWGCGHYVYCHPHTGCFIV